MNLKPWLSFCILTCMLTACYMDQPTLQIVDQHSFDAEPNPNPKLRTIREILLDKKQASRLIKDLVGEKVLSPRSDVKCLFLDGNLLMTGHITQEESERLPEAIHERKDLYTIEHFYNYTHTTPTVNAKLDARLTNKVRHILTQKNNLNDANIICTVDQQRVFLMGRISSDQAKIARMAIQNLDDVNEIINLTGS